MKSKPIAAMAGALLTMLVGAFCVNAQANKHDRAAALTAALGLNNQQTEEIRKVYADFDAKIDPVEEQLWSAHHEARTELQRLLNDEQRAKAPQILKEEKQKELRSIGTKVGLTDQQWKQVEGTLTQFENRFKELAAQKPEDARKGFRELKHEMCAAVGQELNDEQRVRLQGVIREEFQQWQQPGFRREHVRAIEDKLGLSPEQKTQAEKVVAACERTSEKPLAQLKELCQQERQAIDKVLTDEQRAKLNQLMKGRGGNQ